MCFKNLIEVHGCLWVQLVLDWFLHFNENRSYVVKCHVHDFSILIRVKEGAILVDYNLMCWIRLRQIGSLSY